MAPYYDRHLITTNIFFGASLWCDGFVIVRSLTAIQCFTSCIARVLAHPSDRRSERYDQQREPQLSAVVQHLAKQAAVPIGRNRRPQDFNVAHGLDETFRIARRSIDVDNDGIMRIVWCKRDGDASNDPIVSTNCAERAAPSKAGG